MKTGMQAMRLGVAKYCLPFFFVMNPALIMKGTWDDIVYSFVTCLVGVGLIGASLEGYLFFMGAINLPTRVFIFASGILLGFPTAGDRSLRGGLFGAGRADLVPQQEICKGMIPPEPVSLCLTTQGNQRF